MGMFDSVFADCPDCGSKVEFQTKAGPCLLKRYSADSVPAGIAEGVKGQTEICDDCGAALTLNCSVPRVSMYVRKVTNGNAEEEYD